MAAKQSLEDLRQEVTCPLCLGSFEDPRVLSCQHVYCRTCLDALASRGGNVSLTCPECRKKTALLEEGVNGLPVAFHMNRLKELVAKMTLEEKEGTSGIEEVDAVGTVEADVSPRRSCVSSCTRHPSQTLDVYCHKCKEVVCRDCILFDKEHANHPYDKLGVVTKEQREAVENLLDSLQRKQPAIQGMMADVRNAHDCIVESWGVISAKIAESFDRTMSVIEEKKQNEVQRFRSEATRKMQEFKSHEMTLKNFMSEVSAVQSLVERGKLLSDVDFMACKKGMIFKINQMHSRIDQLLVVQHESDLNARVIGSGSVEEAGLLCDRYLQPYKVVDPLQCTSYTGSVTTGDTRIQIGEAAITSIVLKDSDGTACCIQQCVTVELSSARFGETVPAKVVVQSASRYEALYTPSLRTRGNCQLLVKVNGCLIGSKPVPVFVECPPKLLGEPVCIINNFQQPACLKIVNDRMFCLTDCEPSEICIFDLNNTSKPPVRSDMFPRNRKIQKWWPCEMTVDSTLKFLFISDQLNGMVHKFTIDGRYVKSSDTSKARLKRANGLSVARDGNLYVCDSDSHCIHVFNQSLVLLRTFGSLGTAPGMLNWPDNIAFDSSGQFYVTDYRNHRIQCFTSNEQLKWCTRSQAGQPGELNEPNVMHVVGCNVFITDENGVSVFTTSGEFVVRFSDVIGSDGIAVDKDGFVFVSDSPNNRIIVF